MQNQNWDPSISEALARFKGQCCNDRAGWRHKVRFCRTYPFTPASSNVAKSMARAMLASFNMALLL